MWVRGESLKAQGPTLILVSPTGELPQHPGPTGLPAVKKGQSTTTPGIWDLVKGAFPFLLAHHPACYRFDGQVWSLGRLRFCLGCSVAYPLALMVFLVGILVLPDLLDLPGAMAWSLLGFGIAFGSLQSLRFIGFGRSRTGNLAIKVALGVGLGLGGVGLLTVPLPTWLRLIALVGFSFGIIGLGATRIRYLRTACAPCHYHGDWEACPGWVGVNDWTPEDGPDGRTLGGLEDGEFWLVEDSNYDLPLLPTQRIPKPEDQVYSSFGFNRDDD